MCISQPDKYCVSISSYAAGRFSTFVHITLIGLKVNF